MFLCTAEMERLQVQLSYLSVHKAQTRGLRFSTLWPWVQDGKQVVTEVVGGHRNSGQSGVQKGTVAGK